MEPNGKYSPEELEARLQGLYDEAKNELDHLEVARGSNNFIWLADKLHDGAELATKSLKRSTALVGAMGAMIGAQYLINNHEVTLYSTIAMNTIGGSLLGDAIRPVSRISEFSLKRQAQNKFAEPEYVVTDQERLNEVRHKLATALLHEEGVVPPDELSMWLDESALHEEWKSGGQYKLAHLTDAKLQIGESLTAGDTKSIFMEAQRDAQVEKRALWRMSLIGSNKVLDIVAGNAGLWAGWLGVKDIAGENYALLTSIADDTVAVGITVVTTPVRRLLSTEFVKSSTDKIKNLLK